MRNKKRWNIIGSCALAFCLVCTLMLSGNTFGVRAEGDQNTSQQTQEQQSDQAEKDAQKDNGDADVKTQAGDKAAKAVENSEKTKYEVYIDKGNITFGKEYVEGYVKNENSEYELQKITYSEEALYVVTQTDSSKKTTNYVKFTGSQTKPYHVVLKDVNMGRSSRQYISGVNEGGDNSLEGMIFIPAQTETKKVYLYLSGKNVLNGIRYYTGDEYNNALTNADSFLTIDNAESLGMAEGKLYIPEEVNKENISEFVSESNYAYNRWNAAIGGTDEKAIVTGLTICGGDYQVLSTAADNCSAIGGGGNGEAEVNITGGNIYAVCNGTGAAIGGGIGYSKYGGKAQINISGGTVYTMNYGKMVYDDLTVGGVAIGGGSSFISDGSSATVNITGGNVTAYAVYGNGIGSGNSAKNSSNQANIHISDGFVKTNAIGGGSSESAVGGSATIKIDGGNTTCESLDNNYIGAFGIGGGFSKQGNGGNANVTVNKGTLNCGSGTIGGGSSKSYGNGGNANIIVSAGELYAGKIGGGNAEDSESQYNGGDASIYVTGGMLDCASIGGGNSVSGTPGAVNSEDHPAGVTITGGTVKAGTIGGGTNEAHDIGFATADISGGTIQGQFILSNTDAGKKCTFNMTGGTINNSGLGTDKYSKAQENGGAVYLTDPNGEVKISGGTIMNSTAQLGGAIYMTAGTFQLSGSGAIFDCVAEDHGGAVYLKDGKVTVSGGTIGREQHPNKAQLGGGVYMAGGDLTVADGRIGYNTATSGGAAYLAKGTMALSGGTINDNTAAANGGGTYLAKGNLQVKGGAVSGNHAEKNGGGAYLADGKLNISGGSISSNDAAADGGGAYLAGGVFYMTDGKVLSNTAQNGGGTYVSNSTVRMFGGSVNENKAAVDGGGMYVSSIDSPADVVLRSGKLCSNTAGSGGAKNGDGGGLAVVSSKGSKDHVIIGLNETHPDLNTSTRSFTAFDYSDAKDENKAHNHAACMVLENNLADGNGGGIYMSSSAATLDVYCLQEQGNQSKANKAGGSVMATGGQVNIGDSEHNNEEARGNIVINTSMLVSGGNVDIFGNMKNPYFSSNILVDIKDNAGRFTDHRISSDVDDHNYKVQYFENFFGSGIYSAMQYDIADSITAEGTLFAHEGYKIKEWNTKADGSGTGYSIGTEIGSKNDHTAWKSVNDPLILYAIWEKIKYTVTFDPNSGDHAYTGIMPNQTITYGEKEPLQTNRYHIDGMRFVGWNTEADGNGTAYAADYSDSRMTQEDGATIPLYAQWVVCTHSGGDHPGTITYTVKNSDTIEESCDCGGHTASIRLSAADVYHDGFAHPAKTTTTGTLLTGQTPQVTYQYSTTKDGAYGALQNGETEPTSIGYYKATLTLEGKSVTVSYRIMSPGEGFTVNAKGATGQIFDEFNGTKTVDVAKDDAVTIEYDMQKVNGENYKTAPQLVFSRSLPAGTRIIMQTGGNYWYCNVLPGASAGVQTLELSDFTAMGGSEKFVYDTTGIAASQSYRFVVDLSHVKQTDRPSGTVEATFSYQYTAHPDTDLVKDAVNIRFGEEGKFSLTKEGTDGNWLKITAPEAAGYSRWENRSLVLKLAADGDTALPADAKLTVIAVGKTQTYALTHAGEFVVPLTWSEAQDAVFSLDSDVDAQQGNSWNLIAKLFVAPGLTGGSPIPASLQDTGESCDLNLMIPRDTSPSLRITGNRHLLTRSESLPVTVAMRNVDGANVHATIQKKEEAGTGYSGNFLDANVPAGGEYKFNLGGITEAGSYRLLITVTKSNQTLLSVPYYFIVK